MSYNFTNTNTYTTAAQPKTITTIVKNNPPNENQSHNQTFQYQSQLLHTKATERNITLVKYELNESHYQDKITIIEQKPPMKGSVKLTLDCAKKFARRIFEKWDLDRDGIINAQDSCQIIEGVYKDNQIPKPNYSIDYSVGEDFISSNNTDQCDALTLEDIEKIVINEFSTGDNRSGIDFYGTDQSIFQGYSGAGSVFFDSMAPQENNTTRQSLIRISKETEEDTAAYRKNFDKVLTGRNYMLKNPKASPPRKVNLSIVNEEDNTGGKSKAKANKAGSDWL